MTHKLRPGWTVLIAVLLMLSACTGVANLTPSPVPPTATPVPPTATPLPSPTPTPAVPNPKTDPMAAFLFASNPSKFHTAEFTYAMKMSFRPGDDASAAALEPILAGLQGGLADMTGSGAMEIVDTSAGKVNMRMTLEMGIAGQKFTVDTVMVDGQTWARLGPDQPWQKSEEQMPTLSPGMDPASLVEMAKNATDISWLEETELNGERVHRMRYTLDPQKLDFKQLLESTGGGQLDAAQLDAMLKEMTVEAELWLRASDLMIRQQRMLMSVPVPLPEEAGLKDVKLVMDADVLMTYTSVNEPVVIQAPEQ